MKNGERKAHFKVLVQPWEEEYNDDDLIHATVGEDLGLHELVTATSI